MWLIVPVKMMRIGTWVVAGWLGAVTLGAGQSASQWLPDGLPKAVVERPESMVWDAAGLLTRKPEVKRAISERLLKLRQDHGFQLFVVVKSGLGTATPVSMAADLQQQWLPQHDGLVMVFEADSQRVGVGQEFLTRQDTDPMVPSVEMSAVLASASESMDPGRSAEENLNNAVAAFDRGFREYFVAAAVPPPAGRGMKLGLLVVGGLSLLGLGGILTVWLIKCADRRAPQSFRFPEAVVSERLSAPCGGGPASVRKFR